MINTNIIKYLPKIFVTTICFILIVWKVDINQTFVLIKLISLKTISISIFIFLSHYFAVSLRWQFYVNAISFCINFKNTLKVISIGLATNQVFFGTIAMDTIRVIYLKKKTNLTTALGSVFLDRYSALQSMWIILTIIFFFDNSFTNNYYINSTITIICWGGLGSLFLPFIKYIKIYKFKKTVNFLHNVSNRFNCSFKKIKNFIIVYVSSFFILLSSGLVTWLIAIDLGAEITFLQSLMVTLLGILITVIPISINGWGIREISFISLLGAMNISAEKSVLISVTFGLIFLTSSVIGIFFYLFINED